MWTGSRVIPKILASHQSKLQMTSLYHLAHESAAHLKTCNINSLRTKVESSLFLFINKKNIRIAILGWLLGITGNVLRCGKHFQTIGILKVKKVQ